MVIFIFALKPKMWLDSHIFMICVRIISLHMYLGKHSDTNKIDLELSKSF